MLPRGGYPTVFTGLVIIRRRNMNRFEFRTTCSSEPHDYASCPGPHGCAYCRAILSETPEQACRRIASENQHYLQRHRAAECDIYRAATDAAPPPVAIVYDATGIPDPYASALARRTQ